MCYVEKKLSLPHKVGVRKRLKLLYPLQCHKYCQSKKVFSVCWPETSAQAQMGRKGRVLVRGPTVEKPGRFSPGACRVAFTLEDA